LWINCSLGWETIFYSQGAVHKVRHARGVGGPRRCDSLWQGARFKEHVTSHLNSFHTYETWNLKWCVTFSRDRCILTERGRTKTTPDKTSQTWKDPLTKPRDKNPREQLRQNLHKEAFVRIFCTKPSKNRVGVRDVWRSVAGGGGKNWPKIAWRTLWTAPSHLFDCACLDVEQVLHPQLLMSADASCYHYSLALNKCLDASPPFATLAEDADHNLFNSIRRKRHTSCDTTL